MEHQQENKILIILDLDETLFFATKDPLERPADLQVEEYSVYLRPFLQDFLRYVKEHFMVAVWSSASDRYVEAMVQTVFPEEYPLAFAWGRGRCVYKQSQILGATLDDESQYLKPLKKVKRKGYDLDQVLVIDDTPAKLKRNFGNLICAKGYYGDVGDCELEKLMLYLDTIKGSLNTRSIEKRNWRSLSK